MSKAQQAAHVEEDKADRASAGWCKLEDDELWDLPVRDMEAELEAEQANPDALRVREREESDASENGLAKRLKLSEARVERIGKLIAATKASGGATAGGKKPGVTPARGAAASTGGVKQTIVKGVAKPSGGARGGRNDGEDDS